MKSNNFFSLFVQIFKTGKCFFCHCSLELLLKIRIYKARKYFPQTFANGIEGQLVLRVEEFDLNDVINEVTEDLQMTTKKHRIIKELQQTQPIKGDRERISQVIVNLLSNAIKYSPNADRIIIKTASTDADITVCIQDFGIGISEEMQQKLFKRFFRVTDGSVSTFAGLGLGLFIAKEIVSKHHGRMWVESTPNKGATFCFTLPYNL